MTPGGVRPSYSNMKELHGKVAVVTGASQGIGRAIAFALAREGCAIVLIARNKAALNAVATEIKRRGGNAAVEVCDVSRPEALVRAVGRIEDKAGRIDILVNNAGVGTFKPIQLTTLKDALAPVQVPFGAAVAASWAVIPGMLSRGIGHIVNLTSPAGYFAFANSSAYSAARYAMIGLSLTLHEELKPKGVGVTLVCPGAVNTGYFDTNDASLDAFPRIEKVIPRLSPEEVAERVVRAIRANRREVIFPWILWFLTRFYQTLPRFTYYFLKYTGLLRPTKAL